MCKALMFYKKKQPTLNTGHTLGSLGQFNLYYHVYFCMPHM